MAIVRIPDENRSLQEHDEVRDYLRQLVLIMNTVNP